MTTTLNQLLEIAIQDEITSQKFYRNGSRITKDQDVRQFLESLAQDEEQHERILEGVRDMEIYDGTIPVDSKFLETGKDAHVIDDEELNTDLSLNDIFEIALKKENKAQQVYGQIAAHVDTEELKKLFTNLAEQEQLHFKKLQEKYHASTGQMGYEM